MKKIVIALSILTLTACQQNGQHPADATPGEVNMAEMMGISVEELRNQTPEEHMKMMQEMMKGHNNGAADGVDMMRDNDDEAFLPGMNANIADLPEAKETETIEVADGDTIELNPTLVRKEIAGKSFAMYGYNEQIPGPMIKAPQNATITVDVTNKIDMETTIHWHGLRLDNEHDGVPELTQEVIKPNGTHQYTVKFPDEGIYWYHPHVREDIQQDMGLYGNLFVTPTDSSLYNDVNREEVIILDDLMVDVEGMPVPYGKEDATFPLMGRFGNIMLVNGSTEYDLSVERGSVVRFYITNVANTRTFKINIDGGSMKLIGADVGRYENEEWVDAVTIAPAERYIVEVLFEDDGRYTIMHESPVAQYDLGSVEVTSTDASPSYAASFAVLHANDDVIADIDDYRQYFDKDADKTLRLDIEMEGMDHGMMMEEHTDDGIEWEDSMAQMNAMMTGDQVHWKLIDEDSNKENMDIDWTFKVGDIVKIRVINDENSAHPMQHPIHFHGQRFLVLSMDGKENTNLVWKDTVLIPTGSVADLLFDMSNPGDWMFHCHIAEHLTNGMMGMFHVEE